MTRKQAIEKVVPEWLMDATIRYVAEQVYELGKLAGLRKAIRLVELRGGTFEATQAAIKLAKKLRVK